MSTFGCVGFESLQSAFGQRCVVGRTAVDDTLGLEVDVLAG